MALPVTVFRWDDAGAPSITGRKPSDIINILKKCLVEGYGEKAPLGWSVAFEDLVTIQIAFQNDISQGGSGSLVRFWAPHGDTASKMLYFSSASSGTGLDGLINQGYTKNIAAMTYHDSWVVIGTARSFYLLFSNLSTKVASATSYLPTVFVGDIDAAMPHDAGRFIVGMPFLSDSLNTSPPWNLSIDMMSHGGEHFGAKMYDVDGHDSWQDYCALLPFGYGSSTYFSDELFSEAALARIPVLPKHKGDGKDITSSDRDGVPHSESLTQPMLRGFIPGMVQSLGAGGGKLTWPQIKTISNVDYWMLRAANRQFTDRYIRLDTWY